MFDFICHHDLHGHHGDDLLDTGFPGAEHLHLQRHSDAVDSDNDGFSNAVEAQMHTNPFDPHSHPQMEASWLSHPHHHWHESGADAEASWPTLGHHHGHERDTDHDGFPDTIERMMGTDPFSAASHPDVTLAHHFPEGTDMNLPATVDLAPHSSIDWRLP